MTGNPITEGHPMIQFHPILIQLATIPAVAIASYKALNVWRAVSALPLNPHSSPTSESNPSATSECWKKWRALTATKKAKKIAIASIAFSLGVGFNLFFVYVLPKITSQSVFDAICCVFMIIGFTSSIRYTSDVIIPTQRNVKYNQRRHDSPVSLAFAFEGDRKTAWKVEILRQSLSLLVTIGILYSTYAGYTYFHPILAASYIISAIGTLRYPTMSIRRVVQIVSSYLAFVPVLAIIIGVVTEHFSSSDKEPNKEEKKVDDGTMPSEWVMSLLFIFAQIFGVMIPSVLTAMTLRFEYSLVHEPIERSSETSSDAPVQIPTNFPSFPKPIFLSSLFSLFISLAIIETITYVFPKFVWLSITPVTMFITVPVVFIGTAIGAVWCGKFGQWWRYTEVWIPSSKTNSASNSNAKDLNEEEVSLLPTEQKSDV